jgi:urease gamma subunit
LSFVYVGIVTVTGTEAVQEKGDVEDLVEVGEAVLEEEGDLEGVVVVVVAVVVGTALRGSNQVKG